MMKRILLCLALLLCLAVPALAGGAEARETVEYFKKPAGDNVLDAYIYGENMPEVYTYGGSKRDWVHDMAIAPDGRIAITGYTESSDGTLSDRTKTWRAGWVMMLDSSMNVLWNFCSRSGDADHMLAPVFHDDGSLSVVHETEGKQLKIVWVDKNGEETFSNTVMSGIADDQQMYLEGVTAGGYLLERMQNYGARATYTLFDWAGNALWKTEEFNSVTAVSERHLIGRKEDDFYLYSLGENGTGMPEKMSLAYEDEPDGSVKRAYGDMISLEDGGVVACGAIWEGSVAADAQGLISRWDAQGNLVFEMIVTLGRLTEIERTETGFAASCADQEELGMAVRWSVLEFDEKGILCGTHALRENGSTGAGSVLALEADGTLLCAQTVGELGAEDAIVTRIQTK